MTPLLMQMFLAHQTGNPKQFYIGGTWDLKPQTEAREWLVESGLVIDGGGWTERGKAWWYAIQSVPLPQYGPWKTAFDRAIENVPASR